MVLLVTFGMKDNDRTEYIKFEVVDFDSTYHAILGRPALAKFMAMPHYIYLLLMIPGKTSVLTLCGDLKKSYDCDQEAIKYATISRVPELSAEVLAAAQKLIDSEMMISGLASRGLNPTPATPASRPSSCKKATHPRLL
jgi:hypothetical protein